MTDGIYNWDYKKESAKSDKTQDILLEIREKKRIMGYWESKKRVAQNHIKANKTKIKLLERELLEIK